MNTYLPNIPTTAKKRIVIAGSGFAGLKLARKLMGKEFQIILIDKNNFHQFQPLLYQVATAGLEPGAISSKTVIWSAGIKANTTEGFLPEIFGRGGRIRVDRQNRVKGHKNVFALGDISLMETPKYTNGHPQVAQLAIQQAKQLVSNLVNAEKGKPEEDFEYFDKGSLATIGRNLAVADLPFVKLKGFMAWVLWSFVHLFTIMGVKNRLLIFLNWSWNYFTYDQSLRLLIKPNIRNKTTPTTPAPIKTNHPIAQLHEN